MLGKKTKSQHIPGPHCLSLLTPLPASPSCPPVGPPVRAFWIIGLASREVRSYGRIGATDPSADSWTEPSYESGLGEQRHQTDTSRLAGRPVRPAGYPGELRGVIQAASVPTQRGVLEASIPMVKGVKGLHLF